MLLHQQRGLLPRGSRWNDLGKTSNLFGIVVPVLTGLVVIALWHAPIYGWALLISGIARRANIFLWAVLPPLVIGIFGKGHLQHEFLRVDVEERLLGAGRHGVRIPNASEHFD